MSFAFMPVYTGDYLRDTRHLTPMRHGVYLLLLMHCWDQKGPVPRDEQEAAGIANCRSADEIEALRYVLARYFVLMDDGWYNKRMAEEVARAEAISDKNSKAGKASAAARAAIREASRTPAEQPLKSPKDTPVERPGNERSTSVERASVPPPPPPHSPPQPSKSKAKARSRSSAPVVSAVALPPWLKTEDWQDFLDARAKVRKPMTEAAQRRAIIRLGRFKREGHDPAKVLEASIIGGWQGLYTGDDTKGGQSMDDLIAELNARDAARTNEGKE